MRAVCRFINALTYQASLMTPLSGVKILLSTVLLCLGLAGCERPASDAIRFGLPAAPVTLDPRYATDAESARIIRLLYRSLTDFDANLKAAPALADWERPSATRYRFHLGEAGRVFHDGSRLNAEDVAATYHFVLETANASPHRGALENIQSIQVIDPDTVDFELKKPDPLLPGRLSIGIVPARCLSQDCGLNRQAMGSGPFRLADWPTENRLRLQRLSDGQAVEFLVVQDPLVRVLKLLRGELDLLQGNLPPELIAWLAQRPEVAVQYAEGGTFSYLGFNLQDPLTGQLPVRQAIAHALDRDSIIHYLLGSSARPASAVLPPSHWAGAPDLPHYPFAPARARQLLSQAGFDAAHPPMLTYKTSSNPFRLRLATVLAHQLEEVGFRVDIRSYDWGTFYSDIKAGRFQMFSLSWVGVKMPDIFRYAFHSSAIPPAGANRGRFSDPQIDRLIETAEQLDDLPAQAALYREIQTHLLERLPYVPLWYEDQVLVARRGLSGYTLAADGQYDGLITAVK